MKEGVKKRSYKCNLSTIQGPVSRIDVTLLGCDVEDHLTEERTENSGEGSERY